MDSQNTIGVYALKLSKVILLVVEKYHRCGIKKFGKMIPEHSYAEMEVVFRDREEFENNQKRRGASQYTVKQARHNTVVFVYIYNIIIIYGYYSFRSQNDSGRINPYGRHTASVHPLAITIFRIVWE